MSSLICLPAQVMLVQARTSYCWEFSTVLDWSFHSPVPPLCLTLPNAAREASWKCESRDIAAIAFPSILQKDSRTMSQTQSCIKKNFSALLLNANPVSLIFHKLLLDSAFSTGFSLPKILYLSFVTPLPLLIINLVFRTWNGVPPSRNHGTFRTREFLVKT